MTRLLTIGLLAPLAVVAATFTMTAPAAAQHRVVAHSRVVHNRAVVRRGPGWNHRARRVCTWRVRYHRRVRVCR